MNSEFAESRDAAPIPDEWLPSAGEVPDCTARIRRSPEDFVVEEVLGFEPDDDGPHWLLRVRKRCRNTQDVARWLAKQAGVRARDVGLCGLKDRNAVTTQYFSVPVLPAQGQPAEWPWSDDLALLDVSRNRRKLRRGAHRGNRFILTLRGFVGDRESFAAAVRRVADRGFPNYFGEQRFGRNGGNPDLGRRQLREGRVRRGRGGIEVSALRSLLFNRILAGRARDGTWDRALADDLMILDGTGSFFRVVGEAGVEERLRRLDIHPSGPLWGVAGRDVPVSLYARERDRLGELAPDADLLEKAGFDMARRALRAGAPGLDWRPLDGGDVELTFSLGRGVFATALLRELLVAAPA